MEFIWKSTIFSTNCNFLDNYKQDDKNALNEIPQSMKTKASLSPQDTHFWDPKQFDHIAFLATFLFWAFGHPFLYTSRGLVYNMGI